MQTLTYLDHKVSSDIQCPICLEPVAAEAVQVSFHDCLTCSECMAHWIGSQLVRNIPSTCPYCRAKVDSSNLRASQVSNEWVGEEDGFYDSEEEDSFYNHESDEEDERVEEDDGDESREESLEAEVEGNDAIIADGEEMTVDETPSAFLENITETENKIAVDIKGKIQIEGHAVDNSIMMDSEETVVDKIATQAVENGIEAGEEMAIDGDEKADRQSIPKSIEKSGEAGEIMDINNETSSNASEANSETEEALRLIDEDDGTPEGELRTARYRNITVRRPNFTTRSILAARHRAIPNPFNVSLRPASYNTIYAADVLASNAFMIVAEYGTDSHPIDYYFFWVNQQTKIGELHRLWHLCTFGDILTMDDVPFFKFQGRLMCLNMAVEEYGMVHGASFTIPAAFGSVDMSVRGIDIGVRSVDGDWESIN